MKRAVFNTLSRLKIEIPKRVNPDLQAERVRASFDVSKLTKKLYGGTDAWRKRKEIEKIVFQEPEFKALGVDKYNMTKVEEYENSIPKGLKLAELALRHGWKGDEFYLVHGFTAEVAFGLQFLMVIPTIERLGTPEQQEKWLPLCRDMRLIGSYVQTEIGHVGKSSNFCIVVANLITEGRKHGIQAFFVPIRDLETHQTLPGVHVGDIGSKMGAIALDNGYLALDNVRIPRENMLSRYAKVTPDGKFEQSGADSRLATLATLMRMRNAYGGWSYQFNSQAATIATRYSAVRRQGQLEPGGEEPKVLDFQTQQYKLLPAIALSYATWFQKEDFSKLYNTIYKSEIIKGNFQHVPELHAQSCALKAFVTDLSTEAMETCRRACGGHGFLMSAGIPSISMDHLATVTAGGDSTVLYQQVTKYLLKWYAAGQVGRELPLNLWYMKYEPGRSFIREEEDCRDVMKLSAAFKQRAHKAVRTVAESLEMSKNSGVPAHEAWNQHQVQIVNAAKAHCDMALMDSFAIHVGREQDDDVRNVLNRLCQLHGLYRIHVKSGEFIKTGALTTQQVDLAEKMMYQLLAEIRPDAIPLVDAFDHSDAVLGSTIGSYDGNVYERLLTAAQDSPLNKEEVWPSFQNHIKPFREKMQFLDQGQPPQRSSVAAASDSGLNRLESIRGVTGEPALDFARFHSYYQDHKMRKAV